MISFRFHNFETYRKSKKLTWEERRADRGRSYRSVEEELGVSKTQVQNIVKDKEDIN